MRPSGFELWRLSIPLKGSFAHAASSRTTSEVALVAVHDGEGRVGWGEALPRTYVTGEDLGTLLSKDAPQLAERWCGREIGDMDELVAMLRRELPTDRYGLSCFGAFELALLDLGGQWFGRSIADVLGGIQRDPLPAGIVIGFEVPTAKLERHCGVLRYGKRRHIKLKVGAEDDFERMAICARVFGDLKIRIDANAAWAPDEALRRLEALARFPIASVEQPVAPGDLATMRRIRETLGLAVMADESVCTAQEAVRVVDEGAADVLNVRVGKMGGVLATAAICELSRSRGIATSLGTMVGETGVLSVASEVLGRCVPGFDYLDGKGQNAFLLAEDILEPDSPDTGPARVSRDRVRKYANAEPTTIGRV